MRKETAVIAIIVAAVAGFFVGNMTAKKGQGGEGAEEGQIADRGATEGTGAEAPDIFKVPVGNSPFKGERDALVTIVEFSDFQ